MHWCKPIYYIKVSLAWVYTDKCLLVRISVLNYLKGQIKSLELVKRSYWTVCPFKEEPICQIEGKWRFWLILKKLSVVLNKIKSISCIITSLASLGAIIGYSTADEDKSIKRVYVYIVKGVYT